MLKRTRHRRRRPSIHHFINTSPFGKIRGPEPNVSPSRHSSRRSRNGGKKPPITSLVYTRRLPLPSAYSLNKARMGVLSLSSTVTWASGIWRTQKREYKGARAEVVSLCEEAAVKFFGGGRRERDRPRSTHPTRFHVSATSVLPPVCSCVWVVCVCVCCGQRGFLMELESPRPDLGYRVQPAAAESRQQTAKSEVVEAE